MAIGKKNKTRKKPEKPPKLKEEHRLRNAFRSQFGTVVVYLIIAGLIYADYSVLSDLFYSENSDLSAFTGNLIAAIFAAALEIIPFVFGSALSKLTDKDLEKGGNEWIRALITVIISGVIALFIFGVVVFLRAMEIFGKAAQEVPDVGLFSMMRGAFDAYRRGDYDSFLVDCFLAIEPILTSNVAFLLSFMYIRDHDTLNKLRKNMQEAYSEYWKRKMEYDRDQTQLTRLMTDLWEKTARSSDGAFRDGAGAVMPEDWTDYQTAISKRLQESSLKNTNNYIFMTNIERFNTEVESELETVLFNAGAASTIPNAVVQLGQYMTEVIRERDSRVEPYQKWLLENCRVDLEAQFWNAVIAQPLIRPKNGKKIAEQSDDLFYEPETGNDASGKKTKHNPAPHPQPGVQPASEPKATTPYNEQTGATGRDSPYNEKKEPKRPYSPFNEISTYPRSEEDTEAPRTDQRS